MKVMRKRLKAQKCNMCIDRLETGLKPICVLACPNRALDFGPLSLLRSRYGNNAELEDLPQSNTTKPSVVFKCHASKRQLVTYDAKRAMELFMRRDPLPVVFQASDNITVVPAQMIGRDKLVIKHKTSESFMRYTQSDEG